MITASDPALDARARAAYERTVAAWPASMMRTLPSIPRYTTNPRLNDPAVPDVMESLCNFGARQPIVTWTHDGAIIVGDTRWLAAERLGWPAFPVHDMDCTEAEAIAYRLADNKTGERAEWNFQLVAGEFEKLQGLGADLAMSGFRDYEWGPIMNSEWVAPPADPQMPNVGTSGDDTKTTIRFDPVGWERVQRMWLAMRQRTEREKMPLDEAVVRLCVAYLDNEAAT